LNFTHYSNNVFIQFPSQLDQVTYRILNVLITKSSAAGALYGAISATETAVNVIGAVSAQGIYIGTVKFMRGFVFLVMAGFNGIGIILLLYVNHRFNMITLFHIIALKIKSMPCGP